MFCSNCGNKFDDSSAFCPKCGKETGAYRQPNQQRNSNINSRDIVVCIILSFITCGIYGIVWFIEIVNDLNYASDSNDDTTGGVVFLLSLITCGIYGVYWFYKASEKVNAIKRKRGLYPDTSLGVIYLLLAIFGFSIVNYCLIQNELNKYSTN